MADFAQTLFLESVWDNRSEVVRRRDFCSAQLERGNGMRNSRTPGKGGRGIPHYLQHKRLCQRRSCLGGFQAPETHFVHSDKSELHPQPLKPSSVPQHDCHSFTIVSRVSCFCVLALGVWGVSTFEQLRVYLVACRWDLFLD